MFTAGDLELLHTSSGREAVAALLDPGLWELNEQTGRLTVGVFRGTLIVRYIGDYQESKQPEHLPAGSQSLASSPKPPTAPQPPPPFVAERVVLLKKAVHEEIHQASDYHKAWPPSVLTGHGRRPGR